MKRIPRRLVPRGRAAGFTLVEMIIVVFLLALAMLGILAVFDASARINKSEQDVADAQGAVRYGVYQMTRVIRMAGSGGLFVTQAVLNRPDPNLGGITVGSVNGYDNVSGATVTNLAGTAVPVRGGTDMIEVRGVIFSPLYGFDLSSGCAPCSNATGCSPCIGSTAVLVDAVTADPEIGQHFNDDPANRPQFATTDAYTAGVSAANPMLVLVVAGNDEIHAGCSTPFGAQQNSQASYNVGLLTAPTQLAATGSFGPVDFTSGIALQFDNENPQDNAAALGAPHVYPVPFNNVRRAGVLDDVLFFIDDTDPRHPALAQGIRRGSQFDVVTLAEDVEDMQIAYGADVLPAAAPPGDGRITRDPATPITATDTDRNMSNQAGGDEWVPNTPGETTPYTTVQFQSDPAPGTFPHSGGQPAAHCPRLHAVMVSLVAKSRDPDPTYRGPAAWGFRVMNVPGVSGPPFVPTPAIYPSPPLEPRYRRRVQALRINLRNYGAEG